MKSLRSCTRGRAPGMKSLRSCTRLWSSMPSICRGILEGMAVSAKGQERGCTCKQQCIAVDSCEYALVKGIACL
jgi:hypothetical protein